MSDPSKQNPISPGVVLQDEDNTPEDSVNTLVIEGAEPAKTFVSNDPTNPKPNTNGTKKILVVDDEPDAVELFAELLRTNPSYEVEIAEDGQKALNRLERGSYDLLLLDIVMPNIDGIDTLSTIKANPEKYGTPIVLMLTNIGGDIAVQEALKLGAVGYKFKIDTEPDELLEAVDNALNGRPV